MVEIYGLKENIKGVRTNKYYQGYFDRCNRRYFEGSLPAVRVLTAPLLKITQLTQQQVEAGRQWVDAGSYGIAGYDENDDPVILLDRGTSIYHPILTKQTILHEQIHFYIGLEHKHGKTFTDQIRRLAALGALDKLI